MNIYSFENPNSDIMLNNIIMKMRILILLSFLSLIFTSCFTDSSDSIPATDVTDSTTPAKPIAEVDSTEIKKRMEEEAAALALAEKQKEAEKARLAQLKRDSIRLEKKKLAEAKAKKEKARQEAAKKEAAKKEAAKKSKAPKIKFEKTVHDFGTIKEGEVIKHEFFFKNTGNDDLLIMDATATCGCTAPGFSFFPLKPGDESAITVTYNSKHKAGKQRPEITVITNTDPKKHILTLVGVVE